MKIFNIDSLPPRIPIGQQTETGVLRVGFNCAEWLRSWPSLVLSVWAKRPGEAAAYPALSHMDGDVLVWDVNDADTAIAGWGSVEIMGVADGLKKLSTVTGTNIRATMTGNASDPPEAARPWVDEVLKAIAGLQGAGAKARLANVELYADKWVGDESPFSQVVSVPTVTNRTQVDLTPSAEQLAIFHGKDLAFVAENDGGVVTVYAIGQKPANDYIIQATLTEVDV